MFGLQIEWTRSTCTKKRYSWENKWNPINCLFRLLWIALSYTRSGACASVSLPSIPHHKETDCINSELKNCTFTSWCSNHESRQTRCREKYYFAPELKLVPHHLQHFFDKESYPRKAAGSQNAVWVLGSIKWNLAKFNPNISVLQSEGWLTKVQNNSKRCLALIIAQVLVKSSVVDLPERHI